MGLKELIDKIKTKIPSLHSFSPRTAYEHDLIFHLSELDHNLNLLRELSSNSYDLEEMNCFREVIGIYIQRSYPRFQKILHSWSSESIIEKLDRKYNELKREYDFVFKDN